MTTTRSSARLSVDFLAVSRCAAGTRKRYGMFTGRDLPSITCRANARDRLAALSKGDVPMGNPFVHVELMSTDVDKAKSFYGKLFDWKLEDMNMGDMIYTMIRVGEGTGGGLMKNPMPNATSMWVAYVKVDDLRAATNKAKSLGASVMKDVTEVEGAGSFT